MSHHDNIMTSKTGKTDENLKDKLKNFFRISKEKSPAVTLQKPFSREFVFTPEILKDIGPESPSNNRIKTIKELAEIVLKKELEENAIEAVWCSIQDLVLPQVVSEKRHAALHFLQCLLEGQYDSLGILRLHFFNVIQSLTVSENLPERLSLFKILSENGRNLLEFEEETGRFLLEWMPDVVASGKETDFLPLLVSVIKYNAAYLDEDIVSGIVKQTCIICNNHRSDEQIKLSLDVLDTVVCYSYLPTDSLHPFVGALCRMVNLPKYCEPSWELMRKLLGTHLGHSSIGTMCVMLQEREKPPDFRLLRGAIFYIGMALWGSRKVPYLKHTPAVVLPSFLHVLSAGSPIIAYEVILSVQRLVKKYGKEVTHSTWNIILDILETVLKEIDPKQAHESKSPEHRTEVELHDILTAIEQLNEQGNYSGSVNRFFRIVEICAAKRPETSVIHLITHESANINPGKESWVYNLYCMLDKYLRNDNRTKIRLKALGVLSFVLSVNKHIYEEDLINNVVLPQLCHIDTDEDATVRKVAVETLLGLAQSCSLISFMDIVNIVEKVISRPLMVTVHGQSSDEKEASQLPDESHLVDIKAAVPLMVDLFKMKLYSYPPGLSVKLYDLLVTHLAAHYRDPKNYNSHAASVVRKSIIECLLDLRADGFHHLGFFQRASDRPLMYSPYVTCNKDAQDTSPPRSPVTTTAPPTSGWSALSYVDYSRAFSLFVQCLENEKDWEVLKCVLENLPILLQNKTIILSAHITLVDTLSGKLCAMVNDRQLGYPEKLIGVPGKFTRSDFHAYVFPVLASMVTYHNYLDRIRQRDIIKCLEFGMVSKCAKLCVNALRLCTLEMQDSMMRLLPSVLLQLSKISATVAMAIPVLAFLSSIVRLPKMYANFVEDEYMSVFAIALPYTNPFKFSHYTVSLAHHVIAIWFIRCRLPFRKGFVQFIQKGLKANVLQQFEENAKQALQNQNEDSSERGRTGSYSEAALRSRRRMQSGSAVSRSELHAPVDEKLSQFHRELTETCTDVMARYTFGNFSAVPHRSHMAEFLLAGGQTKTWLVGTKLVTITTSGGGTKVGNSGVCVKCQAAYHTESRERSSSVRRRHRSAVVLSQSQSMIQPSPQSSQDDITVKPRSSVDDISLDMSGQDVGVQTGSSLNESSSVGDSEPLESFILGMKSNDPRRPLLNVCNCWCTNWAEIYIRAPSGNLSWMMRIENESGMYNIGDSQVPDITILFASMSKTHCRPAVRQSKRIESGSIGEEEYESLYAQHFADYRKSEHKDTIAENADTLGERGSLGFDFTSKKDPEKVSPLETHEVSQALEIPSTESAKNHDSQLYSTGSLRRSNSSPSIISGSSDTLSPRESISDIVQIGPFKKDDIRSESVKKDTDSDVDTAGKIVQSSGMEINVSEDVPKDSTDGSAPSKVVKFDQGTPDTSQVEKDEHLLQSSSTERKSSESNRPEHVLVPKVERDFSSLLSRQLTPSPTSSGSSTQDEVGELPSNLRRLRGHTIAVVPSSLPQQTESRDVGNSDSTRVGISPSFVFLQLYHSGQIHVNEAPIAIPNNETTERAIKMLDHIYPYETHKIGVIYVGPSQTKDEKAILANEYGSDRYMKFMQSLGTLYRLRDCDQQRVYLGGLNTNGSNGEFTYGWQDESTQLVFHITTLMPNKESDPNGTAKKLHIGNNYVTVVYNDSGEDYKIGVIKGQFNYVNIVIKPLDYGSNAVTLQAKEVPFQDQITTDIAGILGHTDTKIISDLNLAALVRQIAIHCNLASIVLQRQQSQPQDPFANNWLERLRKIRRMRTTLVDTSTQSTETQSPNRTMEDFTKYV